jgi:hypothetical protein
MTLAYANAGSDPRSTRPRTRPRLAISAPLLCDLSRRLPNGREQLATAETPDGYFKMFTARAITSPRIASEPAAWTAIASLAHRESGITSVGLNAVALVKPR